MKTDIFQSCDHCWVFQICRHIECSTLTASYSGIWNNSTGISSPSLALFIVRLPKAHLTLHSRMYDSRWVITSSWLSGSLKPLLYSSLCILTTIQLVYVNTFHKNKKCVFFSSSHFQYLAQCLASSKYWKHVCQKTTNREFPGGPVVKNLPSNAGDMDSIPGPGKTPRATGPLSPHATTSEPLCSKRRHPSGRHKPCN